MKKFLSAPIVALLTVALFALVTFTPGCASTGGSSGGGGIISTNTADKIAPILTSSVAGAVVYAYTKNPQSELYIATIRTAINEFLLSTNLSAANLQATLYGLPIKELKTPEATLIIAPLLGVYQAFADEKVKQGIYKDAGMVTLVQSLVNGLDQGLAGISNIKAGAATRPSAQLDIERITDTQALKVVFDAMARDVQQRTRLMSSR